MKKVRAHGIIHFLVVIVTGIVYVLCSYRGFDTKHCENG